MTLRVALYLRVSTDKQEKQNQAIQLREFAARQGWQIAQEYCDYVSGGKSDRAEFQRMFEDASRRKFDLLLFWALDRLSREGVLETLQHLNRLTAYGIAWRSFTEQFFDSCGPFREAVIAIMATLAKQERIKRSERTRAGWRVLERLARPSGGLGCSTTNTPRESPCYAHRVFPGVLSSGPQVFRFARRVVLWHKRLQNPTNKPRVFSGAFSFSGVAESFLYAALAVG